VSQTRNRFGRCLTFLALLFAASAQAQGTPIEFPVDNFRVAPSTRGYYVTEDGTVLPHLHPSVQLWGNYANSPLKLYDTDGDEEVDPLVKDRMDIDLMIAFGFFDVLELGLVLPATVMNSGERGTVLDRPANAAELGGGFRDIRVVPKVRAASSDGGVVNFAIALPFSVPTGKTEDLLGEEGMSFYPHAILSFDTAYFDLAINGGARIRKDQSASFTPAQPSVQVGNEIFGSIGMRIGLVEDVFYLVSDTFLSAALEEQDKEEVPLETLGGVRLYFENGIVLNAGAGGGLTQGLGTPTYRVLAGIGWEYMPDPDRDMDGLINEVDECPDTPEDMDDFEDVDGCPEPDNDEDGVLDEPDQCPLEPEDKDGFEDKDGCPEPDNDGDQILDGDDTCPNEPEDMDDFEDKDGCPDLDNDEDGVPDATDRCPIEKEDKDGYEDLDGCPELDNDADGYVDTQDKCPMEPEDMDGFEDGDGCPEPDNDRDGFLDQDDKCPNEPETRNGIKDDDGCPDKAKGPVKIVHGKITAPPVHFATGKDRILKKSFKTLDMVADVFLQNPWVKKVRVEGHTDNRGRAKSNLELSKRRAASVVSGLIERGVDPSRLSSEGYGDAQPVADNKRRKGRAANRRVEFVITNPADQQTETLEDQE